MKGCRRWIAGLIALSAASLAVPAAANAADCTLGGSGLESSTTDTGVYQPATGTLKASMLFVDFSDHAFDPADDPPDGPGKIGHNLVDWAAAYYNDVSGGRTSLDVKMDNQWLHLNQPASHYDFHDFASQRSFLADAVAKADGHFDFSGRQILYVVSAPTGGVQEVSPAFSARDDDAILADGTRIRWGASFGDDAHNTTNNYGSHVLAHETGHTFGLPDLYSYQQVPNFDTAHLNAGSWDLMDWIGPGFGFSGWHRLKLGWLDPSQAICVNGTGDVTATLSPLASPGGTKMLISKTSPSTAYVAEDRASTGVDTGICHEGVLIYKVDANAATGGPPGAGPIDIELSDPNSPGDPSDQSCGAIANAPFGVGQSFTDGPVTVQVLSGTATSGYSVRMTGPVQSETEQTGRIDRKLHLHGKKRVVAHLTCPADATSCAGTLTLALSDDTMLGTGEYSVPPPGDELTLNLAHRARKALRRAFGNKDKAKATATLDGAGGTITQKVKLLR